MLGQRLVRHRVLLGDGGLTAAHLKDDGVVLAAAVTVTS